VRSGASPEVAPCSVAATVPPAAGTSREQADRRHVRGHDRLRLQMRGDSLGRSRHRPLHQLGGSLAGNDATPQSSTPSRSRVAGSTESVALAFRSARPAALRFGSTASRPRTDQNSHIPAQSPMRHPLPIGRDPHSARIGSPYLDGRRRSLGATQHRAPSASRIGRARAPVLRRRAPQRPLRRCMTSAATCHLSASRTSSATTTALLCF
jgi:hypothetical protein